jgi:hypothetical protein
MIHAIHSFIEVTDSWAINYANKAKAIIKFVISKRLF